MSWKRINFWLSVFWTAMIPEEITTIVEQGLEMVNNGKTLIHCQAGLNRSGLICTLILMKQGRTAQEAIDLLRERRTTGVLCNPYYVEHLLAL